MKKLHTLSNIFFKNPIVVTAIIGEGAPMHNEYRILTKGLYHLIKGTWGFSNLRYETKINNSSSFSVTTISRAYFCFEEQEDALQFLLSSKLDSKVVKLWPDNLSFTIHEYVEEDQQ